MAVCGSMATTSVQSANGCRVEARSAGIWLDELWSPVVLFTHHRGPYFIQNGNIVTLCCDVKGASFLKWLFIAKNSNLWLRSIKVAQIRIEWSQLDFLENLSFWHRGRSFPKATFLVKCCFWWTKGQNAWKKLWTFRTHWPAVWL